MRTIASHLKNFEVKKPAEGTRTVQYWQDFAAKVIKEFRIEKSVIKVVSKKYPEGKDKVMDWPGMIFRKAKYNLPYLAGKVDLAREKCQMDGGKIENYGHYLISLFRKEKPWDKK